MEYKYEPIFGDQSLFDGAPEDVDMIGYSGGFYKNSKDGPMYCCGCTFTTDEYRNKGFIAMRRVIKEPVISGDIDDLIKDEFSEWWEKEGCIVRSGVGDREITCAFAAFRKLMPEILAARGLKKTPVWTKADQLAGRLPEVSCRVDFCHKLNTNWRTGEIKYIDNQVAVIKADGIDRPFVYEFDRVEFKPIETPAEKAQRERNEWAEKASQFIDDELDCVNIVGEHVMRRFYNALKSGELPMPKKDGE